jgi:excisionase family DNA binding protein
VKVIKKDQMLLPFPSSQTISVSRAARLIECSTKTVHRLIERGFLWAYQLQDGGWYRVSYDSVVQYIQMIRKKYPAGSFGTGDPADIAEEKMTDKTAAPRSSP